MRVFIFCILTFFLCISCRKKHTIFISAKNAVTGEPYTGLEYVVVEGKVGINDNKKKQLVSGQLDANGEARLTERFHTNRPYTIRVIPPENNCYVNEINYYYSEGDSKTEFPFEFAECAYSKLIINNINCQGSTDKFELFRQDQLNSLSGVGWIHNGCVNWETNGFSEIFMGKRFYRWEVTRNGILETFYDTIYYEKGEYKTYVINY